MLLQNYKENYVMLFKKIIVFQCRNHTKRIHTLCGQKQNVQMLQQVAQIQNVPFIMSLTTEALLRRKPASVGTSHDTCRAQ